MNDHDRDNLLFLLRTSDAGLADWYKQASADDLEYARQLLALAHIELIDQAVDVLPEFSDATVLLQQFTLK